MLGAGRVRADSASPDPASEDWSLHGQMTLVEQYHPAFRSLFSGDNSLDSGSRGDETFDAVCCFGALYLMPEPFQVAHEMVRVLRPGGRLAILTSHAHPIPPVRYATHAVTKAIGLRMFDRGAFIDLFASSGLVNIEQQIQRFLQFVTARKPA